MRSRGKIVLKLSSVFILILVLVLAASGTLGHLSDEFHLLQVVLFAVAVIALTVGMVWFLTHRLLDRPVRTLAEGMRKLGEGDYSFRFETDRDDEFGTLAESFNQMAEKLASSHTEVRETRDYFEGIVETSGDAIITVNPRGYVYTFNRGAEEMLGYSRWEIIGRHVEKIFADPGERKTAVELLKNADNVLNYESRFLAKDGGIRTVMLTLTRLRDADGEPIGTFGIGKDVTESNALQKKLVHAERFAAIGQALAGLQHALKNMLNAMKGGAYMVKVALKKDDRPLLEEGWAMVHEGIENLTAMTSHMLSYLREWKPQLEEVDLAAMVREIEGFFRKTMEDKGVSLVLDTADETLMVRCDRRLVHSSMMDIISNAVDACMEKEYPEGETPEIRIRSFPSDEGSSMTVAVADNGCGMTPGVLANVFAPFFSTKSRRGTGLGLALTSRTIRLHGGEIEVESELNVGSEFRIIVPAGGPEASKEMPDGQKSTGRG